MPFLKVALPSFLETTVFWLYLSYGSVVVSTILQTPLLPSSSWDITLTRFVVTFIVDYVWRRFLSVGNCTDPGILVVHYAQGRPIHLSDIVPVYLSCMASGVVVYAITEALSPIPYAAWNKSQGLLFCFLFELACDVAHQARNANYFLTEATVLRLAEATDLQSQSPTRDQDATTAKASTSSQPTRRGAGRQETLEVKARGIHAHASLFIATLVSFGAYFSPGGPMLNISYTVMAALAHRDPLLLVLLGAANVLAPYMAGKYVQFKIVEKQKVHDDDGEPLDLKKHR